MRNTLRLFVIVAAASLIFTAMYFGLTFVLLFLLHGSNLPRVVQVIVLVVTVLTPVAVSAWWIFKKLQPNYPAHTARSVATAFGVLTPISLCVALPLSTIVGGYSEALAGYPIFDLVGALVGTAIMTALLSFLACAFTLWIARLEEKAHQAQ
jgi:hypothetical protein